MPACPGGCRSPGRGERVSFGIVFLFTVMPASSSAICESLPGDASFRAHVHQHQVIVRAAADQPVAVTLHAIRQGGRILDDLPLVGLERRLQRFVETDRLARDHMFQRPALDAGEHL